MDRGRAYIGIVPDEQWRDDEELAPIRARLEFLLEAHSPYMAVVVDRLWNVVMANAAAGAFVGRLFASPPAFLVSPPNLMSVSLHPDGLRQHLVDWESPSLALLRLLEGDAHAHPSDRELQALLAEVRSYPGIDALDPWMEPGESDLLVEQVYRVGDEQIRLFTSIATLGAWRDATLSELRIETFFPADADSDCAWKALVSLD